MNPVFIGSERQLSAVRLLFKGLGVCRVSNQQLGNRVFPFTRTTARREDGICLTLAGDDSTC